MQPIIIPAIVFTVTAAAAVIICLQNLYRIFYPQPTDLAAFQPPSNPWFVPTCQSLPLIPPVQPVPAQKALSDGKSKSKVKKPVPEEFDTDYYLWLQAQQAQSASASASAGKPDVEQAQPVKV